MTEEELYQLKYPIGEFARPKTITKTNIELWIKTLEKFPNTLFEISKNLNTRELNYKYRPGGWTIREVIHHCSDSHINSITRFKLALTENTPTIRPYDEKRWANLIDYTHSVDSALHILKGVHEKLCILLRNLSNEDLKRDFIHPEHGKRILLEENIGIYAWHSSHHLAHIYQALKFKEHFYHQ